MRNYNIKETYVGKDNPWPGILAAAEFEKISTANRLKFYGQGKLVFGGDMILPITHKMGWELILHQKKRQVNKDIIHEKNKRVNHY